MPSRPWPLMLSALAANATPITVPNASFESPVRRRRPRPIPTLLTGWVFNVKGGSAYGTEAISSNFSSAGAPRETITAFINNDDPNVTDTITSAASLGTIAPLTKYTLTLAIGNRTEPVCTTIPAMSPSACSPMVFHSPRQTVTTAPFLMARSRISRSPIRLRARGQSLAKI